MKQKPTPQISNLLNPTLPTTLRHRPISLLITLNIHIMDRLPRIMNHFALLDLRLASPLPLHSRLLGSGNMSLRWALEIVPSRLRNVISIVSTAQVEDCEMRWLRGFGYSVELGEEFLEPFSEG